VTTRGPVVIEVTRASAPLGADRFWNLLRAGYFTDLAFFRVIPAFVAQFGIHGDPDIAAVWRGAEMPDDPVKLSNVRGTLTFATAGPNTRTTQLFVNLGHNARLDAMGFSPFGRVVSGMDTFERLFAGYGEGIPMGKGPNQARIQSEGNVYLRADFPELDYLVEAEIIDPPPEKLEGNMEVKPLAPVVKSVAAMQDPARKPSMCT
jgi:peptidyl-prolyl cis-trans isomerase A (cyclophilin A)